MVGAMVSTHHNLVGLARVSTVVQDAQLQRDALTSNEWCHRHASRHPLTQLWAAVAPGSGAFRLGSGTVGRR